MSNEPYPQPAWQNEVLDPLDIRYVRERVSDQQLDLEEVLRELGDRLAVGSSRTVYSLESYNDTFNTMVEAVSRAASAIHDDGVPEVDFGDYSPLRLRVNEPPEQFEFPALPKNLRAGWSPDKRIGYIRAENTEAGLMGSIGVLDPQTRTHYTAPLN